MRLPISLLLLGSLIPTAQAQNAGWLATWTTANVPGEIPAKLPIGKQDVTLRQVVHISQGGKRLRITFTNEFGTTPLHITAAHVAFLSAGSKILPATDKPLTFSGQAEVTIAPGQFISSDSLKGTVPIYSDLVISTALPAQSIPTLTMHSAALTTTYITQGDRTTAEEFEPASALPPNLSQPDVTAPVRAPLGDKPIVAPGNTAQPNQNGTQSSVVRSTSFYFLKNVQVDATRKSAAVVALGDSITDGIQSTPETNRRWPDVFAPLLGANKKAKAFSVLNEGISGNRVLHEGTGPSALDRLQRDVLSQAGVRYVILTEGINDIGHTYTPPQLQVTAQDIIAGLTAISQKAHAANLKIFAATLGPIGGSKYDSPGTEALRQQVNAFIRNNTAFDGVIDFDKAVSDPNQPARMLPKYDSGDHLHPSDQGYAAMAAAINLKLFRKK